ncbi:MAG: selenide, water dikinase SelD [Phycisphaerae bacterium]|nr:selenide, water dikinase SelD [Phycisphaerae bacterium]
MDTMEKRRRVMGRSIKLGHCVCDPAKPCPCALFKERNVCTCAGEHLPPESDSQGVRLTQYVRSAGCASKIGQSDLHRVLAMLPQVSDPRLLVGTATADDAGVFELQPGVLLVQTVDVFTPGVDEPYLFGRIAGCNSLSDVYAMGGRPVTALSVIGFPIHTLPHEAMAEILRGGMDVLAEAGAVLLGGHSINDEEIKFGFAVTGVVEQSHLATNAGAQPGNVLVLTKPLGTGIVALAGQLGRASQAATAAAAASMSTLNRAASEIMVHHGATACTDVTGFGLLGHLARMAVESKITAEVWCESLPLLPDVLEYAAQGMYSGANERNAEFSDPLTDFDDDIADEQKAILHDAQTSGGLLIALPEERAGDALAEMHAAGVTGAVVIGRVTEASEGCIRVRRAGESLGKRHAKPNTRNPARDTRHSTPQQPRDNTGTSTMTTHAEGCCEAGSGTPGQAMDMFQNFMGTALQPGAVDVVTKELMAVALGLAVGCVPCVKIHLRKSLAMGIGMPELEEAAALATAFAGCRALMLWNELKRDAQP